MRFFDRIRARRNAERGDVPPAPRRRMQVTRDVIELIMASSKASHPREFGGLLRMEDDIIIEVLLLPGTISGEESALFQMHMAPLDRTIIGTVHSHPSPYPYPSDADLAFFAKYGAVNIIMAHPYTMESWRAFDIRGTEIELAVVDE